MRDGKRETMVVGARPYQPADSRHKLQHIAQKRLDYIVKQVHTEDYHVERISSLRGEGMEPMEIVNAIHDWAESVHLKVAFNNEYDVCVFERLMA